MFTWFLPPRSFWLLDWSKLENSAKNPGHNLLISSDISTIYEIYNDYHKNPAQYQNHSIYECLTTYNNRFDWRPGYLILISSDTQPFTQASNTQLNDSFLLQWNYIRSDANSASHFLCDGSKEMDVICNTLKSFNSENLGTFNFYGNKIDYALYKATDPVQPKLKTCYLQGSPQVLMSTYAF